MYTTKYYKSKECGHKWLAIDTPCRYGKEFMTCDNFKDRRSRQPAPRCCWAVKDDCLWHGLKGDYDFNRIRMIESVKYGIFSVPNMTSQPMNIVCCVIQ